MASGTSNKSSLERLKQIDSIEQDIVNALTNAGELFRLHNRVVTQSQRCRVQTPLAARTFLEQESLIT